MEKFYSSLLRNSLATTRNFSLCIVIAVVALFSQTGNAQISVTVTGNTNTTPNLAANYASLALALTDVNLVTAMTGPVTLTLNAGASETAPPTGLTIGSASLNPVLSSTNTITIVKAAGAATTLNAGVGTSTPGSAAPDGILKIVGADYITIDGLTFTDGNVANPATMEFGIALFKLSLSDGAQNNTIKNCIFNMQRINNASGSGPMVEGSVGINILNSIPTAATTSLTPTTAAGANSNNKVYTNTFNGGNYGVALNGFAASSPFTAGDTGNDIGGNSPSTGNTILNFGGAAAAANPSAGIRANNQWGINISNNTINNNDGAGVNHPTTLRGIFAQAGTSANATILGNTVTIKGGGTTSAVTAIENGIGSTAASNTITISNNIITGSSYTTATTGTWTGILNSATAANVEMNDNQVTDNTVGAAAVASSCIFQGIYSSVSAVNLSMNFNSITNNSLLNNGGTMYCIRASTSVYTVNDNTINNNTIPNSAGTLAGIIYGFYDLVSPTGETIQNNFIDNLTITGSTTSTGNIIMGIHTNTTTSTKTWSNNTIHTLIFTNSSTGTAAVNGISSTLGTTVNIYNNKIYGLSASGSTSLVSGIIFSSLSTGGTANVYNNLIGDLNSPNGNNALIDNIRGINITATTATATFNLSYNTIYLNATSTGTNFTTSGLFHTTSATATTAALNLRNNIIVNLSTPNGTGLTVAYRRNNTTLTNYGSSSNYNLFYAGTTGPSRLIFYDGTNSDQNLSAYKTRVAPRDASSVTEAPNFISTNGVDADFLHIDNTIATQIESGSANIAGINNDIDGQIRQGNGGYAGTGTAPDIGADEFDGISADLNGPSIVYTTLGNTSCLTDRVLSSAITDASGVNSTAGTKPRLYFKKSGDNNTYAGNTNADNGWKYVEASNASSPFSFTTNYALLQAPVVSGDVIQYFVVAQDLAGTPNVGINSGTFNAPATSVALAAGNFPLTGTINSYTLIAAGLSGTVTVGASGTYTSLTGVGGLFEALNTSGLSGSLTVNILDATLTEPGVTALNAINYNGCSAGPYPLTIKPGAGVNTIISGAVTTALIKLNGADNVTIDGSNNGTSSRNMTLLNTSTASNTAVIWNASLGTNAGAVNNTIKNAIIKAGSNTVTSTFGIFVGGTSISTTGTGDDNDNLAIHNNQIGKAYYGIYARGSATGYNNGLNILNNIIGDDVAADYIGFRGMQIFHADGAILEGNTVYNIIAATSNLRGIELGTGFINSIVSKNKVYEINYTASTNSGGKGITIGTGAASSNVTISNNLIYGLKGHGSATATNNTWGLMFESGGGYNTYYNSINISDDRTTTSPPSNDFSGALYVAAAITALDLRDNIIVCTAAPAGSGKTYGVYCLAPNTSFSNMENNLYWATGVNRFAGFITSDRTTLADMQAGFGQNVNSLVVDPLFNSPTNLQPQTGSPAVAEGTPIGAVTTDYLGVTRNATTPTIGAYEQAADVAAPSITYTPLTFTCLTGNRSLNGVSIVDGSGVPTSGALQPRIYYKKNPGGSWFSSQGTLASGTATNGMWNFTINVADMGGVTANDDIYYYVIAQDLASPINIISNPAAGLVASNVNTVTTHPTSPNVYTVGGTLNGTYTVGAAGTIPTLTEAIDRYNNFCLSGPVVFELLDASYSTNETFPIVINSHPDASSTNTLTIRPASGTAVTISGTSGTLPSALVRLNGADYVRIDGLNTGGASILIEQTSTSAGTAALWLSSNGVGAGASNNIIRNISVKAGVSQNTGAIVTYGIVMAGPTLATTVASTSAGDDNDNNLIENNSITKVRYAIFSRGGSTTNPNSGTQILENVIGPSAYGPESVGKSGVLIREEDGTTIIGNEIRFIGGDYANTSAGADRVAIGVGTDALLQATAVYAKNLIIRENLIHDIVDERTFPGIGITISAVDGANATNNLIANNMIYNVKCNGTADDYAAGIVLEVGIGDKVVYNTIYMTGDTDPNASATTPTENHFGISIGSTSASNPLVKNNIVYMDLTSSSAPSLDNACINIPTAFSWGTGSSNYNNFYYDASNTQSNTGCVGGVGGTFHLTLANWQAASSQDANSQDEEPVFSSSTNLHLIPASNLALDNLGNPVAGVTTDFDGETRHATTPDIGADEFAPATGIDVGVTALVSPTNSGCFTATETVTVALFNYSINPIDFSVNNVTVTVTATGGYSSNITLTSGILAATTSQNVTVPATINLTSNGVYTFNASSSVTGDVTPSNDAMTPVNITVATIGGTYAIGVGQSGSGGYETLTAFIQAYNAATCFTSPVIAELYDATYTTPAETFPIVINDNATSGTNLLTIRPETGVNATITGSAASLIKLNGVDFVVIDGSNNNSDSRNLTISNTSTGTNSTAVWVSSLGTGLGAGQNTIKNSIIKAGSNTVTSTFGIFVGGTSISTTGTGDDNDNLTIQNNDISKAYYGIYARGSATGYLDQLNILNNSIGSNTAADYIGFRGMQIYHADGALIDGNTVFNLISTTTNMRGIELVTGFINSEVNGNLIYEINYTATSNSAGKGITVSSGVDPANVVLSNNVIHSLKGHGSATATNNSWGIMLETGGGYDLYYNSINLSHARNTTSSPTDIHGALYVAAAITDVNLRNNILAASAAPSGGGKTYAVYSLGTSSPFTDMDYNIYWTPGLNRFNGILDGDDQLAVEDMQDAFGDNANSMTVDPKFNSATNLTLLPGSPAVGEGAAIGTVTTDYTGATRNVSATTIGAYEHPADQTGPEILTLPLLSTLCTSNLPFNAIIADVNYVNTAAGTKPRLYFKKSTDANTYAGNTSGNNGWKYVEASNSTSPFSFTTNYALLQSAVVAGDIIEYFVVAQDQHLIPNVSINSGSFAVQPASVNLATGAFPIGGTIHSYTIVAGGLATDVTIGAAGTYTTLSGTGGLFSALNASGITGNITATILDAAIPETGTVALNQIVYGCGGPYTLTIKPGAGVNTVLSGSSTTPLIDFNGADNVHIDGSNNNTTTKNMIIRNTSTSAGSLRFINGAAANYIENTVFESGVTSTTSGVISFSTTTSVGNSGNTLDNVDIRDRSDAVAVPANGIYSAGISDLLNANNSITNSNIFNFSANGINLTALGLGNNWQLSGLNIYNAQATPSASTQNAIQIAGGLSHIISDNFIGGNAPGANGTWTNTGNVIITGIGLTNGVASISNNTVANITATNTGTTARIRGITNTSSSYDGITIVGNTIFNLKSHGTITGLPGGNQIVAGIHVFPSNTWYLSIISDNVIHDLVAENTTALTTSNTAVGMLLTNWRGQCFNNTIFNIINKSTGTTAGQPPIAAGIYGRFYSGGFVYNNMISLGHTETNNVQYNGIMIIGAGDTGNFQHYYHNTVHVGGTATGTFSSHAFLRGDNTTTSSSHPVNARNNIFAMSRTGGGSVNYAIGNQGTGAATSWLSNYNDLYNVVPANVGFWNATGYDLAGWQGASGGDANSINVAPVFVSTTDLHLTLANPSLDNAGTPIVGVNADFDGNGRNIVTPDLGAHEIITSGCSKLITSGADSGAGSLRAAIACAQNGEQLVIDPSVPSITLTTGEISLSKSLIITGHGMENVVLSGNGTSRIFNLQPTYFLQLEDMSMIAGTAPTNGGAFWAKGNMVLKNIRIDSCDEGGVPKAFTVTPGVNIEFIGDNELND